MALICREIQEWVETQIEQPIEAWENQQQQHCEDEPCNWWMLCLNKLVCWLVWVLVKVVRFVLVTVGKWVARVVCEVVSFVLDVVAFVVNLVLSIPIIGGIIRTVLNWLTEIVWRIIGLPDFLLSLVGIRLEKRIYVGLVIPRKNGAAITTEAAMMPQIDAAKQIYKDLCNVKIVYSGACVAPIDAPDGALNVSCGGGGFFSDWWLGGSYIELVSAGCKFSDGWRRVVGLGAQIVIFVVSNVEPDEGGTSTIGCSFASTHNYVVVEAGVDNFTAAHEMGHACWLPHVSDPANLMTATNTPANPTLTNLQISVIRWSKHCVYF